MNSNPKSKLKILMCSEASFLSSGFGTYTKELLSRLNKNPNYIIAEFASYGFVNDHRDRSIDWIYYANAVREDDPRHKEYSSKAENQFGKWRFEKVLLDFKPDVVIDIRDYWMSAYQGLSPLRPYFHWILMPTVDSAPQQEDWVDTYLSADAVFSYSDWGGRVLTNQSNGKINYIDTASPGVNLDVFRIKEKDFVRSKYGLPNDAIIIGSVMRNQKRKLIPELLSTFKKTLNYLESNDPELGKKLYLYLHTSYPDMGWDLPELLKDNKVANKVLFTYLCKKCGNIQCSVFNGPQKMCDACLTKASSMPSVTEGIPPDRLSDIYNLFDLYVQYAICEGFGMPQVEAGACGIPIATVDYSAMNDIVHKLNAFPIPVRTLFKELETKAYRAYPDNDALSQYIIKFLHETKEQRKAKSLETRKLTEQYYNWDNIAKCWEQYLDKLYHTYRSDWTKPLKMIDTNRKIQDTDNVSQLLQYCSQYKNDPKAMGSYKILNILKEADYGFAQVGPTSIISFGMKNIAEYFNVYANNNNLTEKVRSSNQQFDEDFIVYAKMKASSK